MEKYKKVKIVGKGSFGYAMLVQTISDRKLYVMKVIDVSKMDRKQKEEALNEVHVLKAMRHPYIVTYRESFMNKSCLCIVMDYADGGDMYGKIAKQKQLGRGFSEDQILDWFVQICLAMKHIHERKILHRDLKTQNIFLTSKGEVKVGDFGIARVLKSTYDCAQTAIGTPYYLSPEICQEKPYNQRSDIWSLGCILYEMTTLRHAFDSSNMKGLVLKILRGNYPAIPDTYSDNLRNLIAEMLQRDPQQRPSIKRILEKEFLHSRIATLFAHTVAKHELSKSLIAALDPVPQSAGRVASDASPQPRPNPQSPDTSHDRPPAERRPRSQPAEEDKKNGSGEDYSCVIQSMQDVINGRQADEETVVEESAGDRVHELITLAEGRLLPGYSEGDSIYTQIELFMMYLEQRLGKRNFQAAYVYLLDPPEEDNNLALEALVGAEGVQYVTLVYQLVVCQEKYYNH
jgi:NIMA (never in mitosis gene a)-related kinase